MENRRFLVQVEKMTRGELWERCFKMLLPADPYPAQEEAIAQLGQYLQSPEEDDVDESGTFQVLHRVELRETGSEYLQTRTANIMERILKIDEKLNQATVEWKTKRMGKVELAILRLALCEMLYDDAIPEKVSVNGVVKLAKKLGGNDSPSSVNGILTKFVVRGARTAGDARAVGDARVSEEDGACGETQESQETYASRGTPKNKENEV